MNIHQKIVEAFIARGYLTSADLVEIAGFRYGARLSELKKKGFDFIWKYKTDIYGNKTNTTIYTMTTDREKIDSDNMEVVA